MTMPVEQMIKSSWMIYADLHLVIIFNTKWCIQEFRKRFSSGGDRGMAILEDCQLDIYHVYNI